jgi:hypothetical protein
MTTTTHLIQLTSDEYVNVSNGNLNCIILVQYGQKLRIIYGASDVQPLPSNPEHIKLSGAEQTQILASYDLSGDSDVWARAEEEDVEIVVVRGEVRIHISSA